MPSSVPRMRDVRRVAVAVVAVVAVSVLLSRPAYADTATSDGGSRLTAIFGTLGFVVLAAGLGLSAYRLSVARRHAKESGESATRATLRALSGEDDDRENPDAPGH